MEKSAYFNRDKAMVISSPTSDGQYSALMSWKLSFEIPELSGAQLNSRFTCDSVIASAWLEVRRKGDGTSVLMFVSLCESQG